MARSRKPENTDLPANVYAANTRGKIYYRWSHPQSGYQHPLGTDRKIAKLAGMELNNALLRAGIPIERDIKKVIKLGEVIREYKPKLLKGYAENTRRAYGHHLDRIARELGDNPLEIELPVLTAWLEDLPDSMYVRCKKLLEDVYKYAYRKGYLTLQKQNPASVLEGKKMPKAKRERLTLNEYNSIYEKASPHLQIAMDLMLHTTLRPGDVCNLQFSQFQDGCLLVTTGKTGAQIAIELDKTEQDIISKARRSGVISRYVVHKLPDHRGRRKPGKDTTQLTVHALSVEFREIRKDLGIGGDNPPSLAEIRSLSSWLYKQSGRQMAEIQALMTHTSEAMTQHYTDARRDTFKQVKAGLEL